MSKILQKDLETLYKPLICTDTIQVSDEKVFGDKKNRIMKFDVYDGFAYCEDYKGEEYIMNYPQLDFIKLSKEMETTIRECVGLDETTPITASHIIRVYNSLQRI